MIIKMWNREGRAIVENCCLRNIALLNNMNNISFVFYISLFIIKIIVLKRKETCEISI